MCVSIGQIAAENKQEKTGKKCDAMQCNASRCQSLNVSDSINLCFTATLYSALEHIEEPEEI